MVLASQNAENTYEELKSNRKNRSFDTGQNNLEGEWQKSASKV